MTVVSIHQPAYLPWLGYFDRIAKSDIHVVLDNVQFEKGSFINRNKIRNSSERGWQWLTIPIKNFNLGKRINEIEIANTQWTEKHRKAIWQEYHRAPHFDHSLLVYLLEINSHLQYIFDPVKYDINGFLSGCVWILLKWLKIQTNIYYATQLNITGWKKDTLVVDICKKLGATEYLSGPLGRNYLDLKKFEKAGIKVSFHDYDHPVYPQIHSEPFISHLSAIDYIFNCGNKLP